MDNLAERNMWQYQNMNMIRHDAPRNEFVALAVEMIKTIADVARDLRMTKSAASPARVHPLLNFETPREILPFQREMVETLIQSINFRLRDAISQTEGD